jgi:(p)ppGpp synthase/HD superfamily hydrolase
MKLTPEINKAIQVAAEAHSDQMRKADDTRYITHLIATAWITAEFTDDEATICAALLHDIFEDVPESKYSREKMLADFRPKVVEIVEGVSEKKDASITKAGEKETWRDRKKKYLSTLKKDSPESLIICAADKIHNMQSTINAYNIRGEGMWEVFNSSKEDKLWFYTEVVKIIENKLDNPIVEKLNSVLEKYKEIILSR